MNKLLSLGLMALVSLQFGCVTTRSSLEEKERVEKALSALQKSRADRGVQFDEVQEEIGSLSGRIEVLEKRASDEDELKAEEALNVESKEVEEKDKLQLILETLSKFEERLDIIEKKLKNSKRKVVKKVKPKGNYEQAELNFKAKKWQESALGYQKYRELNPKGRNYDRATFRMGVCFQNLRMSGEAKVFFEEVVAKFSAKNTYAQKAKKKLKKLK